MKKVAFILMLLTILSKILGFGREVTLSYFYGASNISDAYLIALSIPSVIFAFIGTGIATTYIPMYSRVLKDNNIDTADSFTSNIINIIMVLCISIVLLGLIFTVPIIKLFALGFEGETLNLAVSFTRVVLFSIFFSVLVYIFSSYLQIKNNYIIPALVGLPFNIIIILSIIISSKYNIMILMIGSIIAIFSELLLLIPYVSKGGYRHKFVIDIHDKYVKEILYLSVPVIISVSVNQINVLIDKTLASQIAVGGISALNYAHRLNNFVQGLFVIPIITVMYPTISKLASENNYANLKKIVTKAVIAISSFVLPVTVGAMIFAEPIVKMLFGRGEFNEQAVAMTSYALFFYAIGMIGFGLREVLSRTFYSLHDTSTPMKNAMIAVLGNIILNFVLSRYLGIGGLALATSISGVFCTFLLFINLKREIGYSGFMDSIFSFVKIILCSLVMGCMAKITYDALLFKINAHLSLILAICAGALVYFFMIYFAKIKEVDTVILLIKKRLYNVLYNKSI